MPDEAPIRAEKASPPPEALRFESTLAADATTVWQAASHPDGINREFRPWLRMTFPRHLTELTPATVPLGARLCRSWLLLFGVIPIDYDDITLVAIDPPHGFSERSSMLSCRVWAHDRTIEPLANSGCRVVDVLRFETRALVPRAVVGAITRAVFRRRHHNLRRDFGAPRAE